MLDPHREPSDRTVAKPDHEVHPPALVHAYESVLQAARRLPPVVMVPSTYRRRGVRRYVRSLPRPTLLLRFFLVQHARASLDHVRRRMLAVSALGAAEDDDETQRQAVTQYLESLPAHRRTLFSVSLALLTIVVTRFVLVQIPGAMEAFGGVSEQIGVTDRLLSTISAVSESFSSLDGLLEELQRAPLLTTAFVITSLATVLYVELRFFVPGFRLKRSLCNLHPNEELLTETPARWSLQRSTGVYDLERSVARRLDAPPPREVPFDLIVPALLMPSLVFLAVLFIQQGLRNLQLLRPEASPLLSFVIASATITCVIARLAWLTRAWLRRLRPDGGPYLPSEVLVCDARLIVAVRDPGAMLWSTAIATAFGIGLGSTAVAAGSANTVDVDAPAAAALLVLAFVVGPVWFRMNRDVSAYLAVREEPRPGRPILSLLAMVTGGVVAVRWPIITAACVFGSAYVTARRVRRAAEVAGAEHHDALSPGLLAAGFVVFPVALAHLQGVLNAVYLHDGDLVDGPSVPTRLAVAGGGYSNLRTSTAVDESA